MKHKILYYVRIAGSLLLICGVVAGLLSAVYAITEAPIAAHQKAKQEASFRSFFPEMAEGREEASAVNGVNALYTILDAQGAVLGYCVDVSSSGYGGKVNLMIGFSSDATVLGINILSHTETKGLTDTTLAKGLFDSFAGKTAALAWTEVDAIGGATISSKAVWEAVRMAGEALPTEVN